MSLNLTRKKAETIYIGEDITIKIIKLRASSVIVGIDAPADVRILRGEVRQKDIENARTKS
jgi:carbon storage regulator